MFAASCLLGTVTKNALSCVCCLLPTRHCVQNAGFLSLLPPAQSALCTKMLISCVCCLLHNRHSVPNAVISVFAASCTISTAYQKRTFLCLLPPAYSALFTKNVLSCVFCLLHNRRCVPKTYFPVFSASCLLGTVYKMVNSCICCLLHNRHSVPKC